MSQQTKQPSVAPPESPAKPAHTKSPWSFPVAIADIPETGRRVDLAADERTRAAVARLAAVVDLPRLEASFDLTRQGHDGLRVTGRVAATVVQNCVVTLEPIENELEEAVDLAFIAASEAPAQKPKAAAFLPIDAEDPPEALPDGVVDLGAVASEFLLLGIDPYPRREGATFDAPAAVDPSAHPFAALVALKKRGNPKDR